MEPIENEAQARALFGELDPAAIVDVSARKPLLKKLLRLVQEHADDIIEALKVDLGRHPHESCMIELYPTVSEIKHVISKLKKWSKPDTITTPALLFPSTIKVDKVPLGKGYIISPFNFPFFLSLPYVAMALAAGNAVLVRPSLKTPKCSEVIGEILAELDEKKLVRVISCDHHVADIVTALPWDKIFYTGSPSIGKHIMSIASDNLIPLTLELGGKSPVIITSNSDIELAARRVAFGKLTNCGQICVAPDYVLIEHSDKSADLLKAFLEEFKKNVESFYGGNPHESSYYSRMVTPEATERIKAIIEEAEEEEKKNDKENKTKVVFGGSKDVVKDEKYVPPTIIVNPTLEMKCMKEEIFGPVLPILELPSLDEIIKFINERPKPLALYAFTDNKEEMDKIAKFTRSGDLVFNDVIVHCSVSEAPFGGVGNSGMGVAHGYQAFLSWCSQRTRVVRDGHGGVQNVDKFVRYAPYDKCHNAMLGYVAAGWKYKPSKEQGKNKKEDAAGKGDDE